MKDDKLKHLFWQELDQALNTCMYFKRDFSIDKAMEGLYERDGKKCWVSAYWGSYLIDWYKEHINEIQKMPTAFKRKEFKTFIQFIKKNKWQDDWYKPYDKRDAIMKEKFSPYMYRLINK